MNGMHDIITYIDLKIEESKLKASDGISGVVSRILSMFIAAVLVIVLLVFLALALMQWLNKPGMLGEPFGTLVAAGVLLLIVLIFFVCGKSMFRKSIDKALTDSLGVDSGRKLKDVKSELRIVERRMDTSSTAFRILKKLFF